MRITENKKAGNTIISGDLQIDKRLQERDRMIVHRYKVLRATGHVVRQGGMSFMRFEAHTQTPKAAA